MKLSVKDPGSALTHFIAMILAGPGCGSPAFEGRVFHRPAPRSGPGCIYRQYDLLYAASTVYHTFDILKASTGSSGRSII